VELAGLRAAAVERGICGDETIVHDTQAGAATEGRSTLESDRLAMDCLTEEDVSIAMLPWGTSWKFMGLTSTIAMLPSA